MMADIEHHLDIANRRTCTCGTKIAPMQCPSCRMFVEFKYYLKHGKSVNQKDSTFNSAEKVNSEVNKAGELEPLEKDG